MFNAILVGVLVLLAGLAAVAVAYAARRRRPPPAPPRRPVRHDLNHGPTVRFEAHPGHPRRWRRSRLYLRTGTGRPAPFRRRNQRPDPPGGQHRTPDAD